ncbi:MAG: cytochrome c biogenesis protein CcsA [Cyanobacteriota bacterium]
MIIDYNIFLNIALLLFMFATVFFVLLIIFKKEILNLLATSAFIVGLIANFLAFIYKWFAVDYIPLTNTFETLILFSLLVGSLYIFVWRSDPDKIIACGCSLTIVLLIALSGYVDDTSKPLMPALQSNWLVIHVLFCITSYAGFAIAFVTAILAIVMKETESINYYKITYQNVFFAYVFLVLGIITGAVWAEKAWGAFWSWDSKETWAFITFLVYSIYLHGYKQEESWTRKGALIVITGFLFIMFTYFGVNYLLPGLHSYA